MLSHEAMNLSARPENEYFNGNCVVSVLNTYQPFSNHVLDVCNLYHDIPLAYKTAYCVSFHKSLGTEPALDVTTASS